MGSTAVKNTVCRPSFVSFSAAIRPDLIMDLQSWEEQPESCIQSSSTRYPHCPAEVDLNLSPTEWPWLARMYRMEYKRN